jgi:hypothetical protein
MKVYSVGVLDDKYFRLLIRHFQEQDSKSFFEYFSNPSVYRFELGEPISQKKV